MALMTNSYGQIALTTINLQPDYSDPLLLVIKLRLMGLDKSALSWVRNYILGRHQSFYVDGPNLSVFAMWSSFEQHRWTSGYQPDVIHDHAVDVQLECGRW